MNDSEGARKYYLLSPVMACHVYGENGLFKTPPYIYQALFTDGYYKIFRTYLSDLRIENTWGELADRFEPIEMKIKTCDMIPLESVEEVIKSVCEKKKICGMLSYHEDIGGSARDVSISFPIKHINVLPNKKKFQVETGTVAVPYPSNSNKPECNSFEVCYVAFQEKNDVEFITFPDSTILRKICRVDLYVHNS